MSENIQDSKIITTEESLDGLDDMDLGVLSRANTKMESSGVMASGFSSGSLVGSTGSISRHSSFTSLPPHDHRPESASPSSFGEDDDEEMDDSDVEIG